MVRTTVILPDDTAGRLRFEARRRGVSIAEIVREAVDRHLAAPSSRKLSFIGIGEGDPDGSERIDETVGRHVLNDHDTVPSPKTPISHAGPRRPRT